MALMTRPCLFAWSTPASKKHSLCYSSLANRAATNFPTIYSAKAKHGRRRLRERRRGRMRIRSPNAILRTQGSTCVTHETSKLRDVVSRLGGKSRSHADNRANIGQRTFSSKATAVRACHQWSFPANGSISYLSAKLAHVRYSSSPILLTHPRVRVI